MPVLPAPKSKHLSAAFPELCLQGYWNTIIKRNFLQNSLPGKGAGNLNDKHMAHGLLGHMTFINQGRGVI